MKRWEYILATGALYAVFGAFCLGCVAAVVSITVFPMMENYRECGSIFRCNHQR